MATKPEIPDESARVKKAEAIKQAALQNDASQSRGGNRSLREDDIIVVDVQVRIPRTAITRLQRTENWGDHNPPQRDPNWNKAQDSDYDLGPAPKQVDTTGDMGKDGFGDPKH